MNFTEMEDEIIRCIQINQIPFITGTYGIGKTAMMASVAKKLNRPIKTVILSMRDSLSIMGLPFDDGEFTGFRKSDLLNIEPNSILFLDELPNTRPEAITAIYQLLTDGILCGHSLPHNVSIVTAGNLDSDNAGIHRMPSPLLNRLAIYEYSGPTFEEWEKYAIEKKVHPSILSFLKDNANFLCSKIDPEMDQSPTPRTWEKLSEYVSFHNDERNAMIAATARVGKEAAGKWKTYLLYSYKLIPISKIIEDPENSPVHDETDMILNYMQITNIVNSIDNSNVRSIIKYVSRISKEFQCLFMKNMFVSNRTKNLMYDLYSSDPELVNDSFITFAEQFEEIKKEMME